MSEREELEYIKAVSDATRRGVLNLYQQGFCAGVGANINKGEKEAIRLGILSGLACLRGLEEAITEGSGQMQQNFETEMDKLFGKAKPKLEIVPAHAVNKNGQLIVN